MRRQIGGQCICLLMAYAITVAPVHSKETVGQSPAPELAALKQQVLDPSRFYGQAAEAYQAARECPHILKQLFDYGGADKTDGFHTLLDSFTSLNGSDDLIPQLEALLARDMWKEGKSLAEIQEAVDKRFANKYPFSDSPALRAYKARRLWSPKAATPTQTNLPSSR